MNEQMIKTKINLCASTFLLCYQFDGISECDKNCRLHGVNSQYTDVSTQYNFLFCICVYFMCGTIL